MLDLGMIQAARIVESHVADLLLAHLGAAAASHAGLSPPPCSVTVVSCQRQIEQVAGDENDGAASKYGAHHITQVVVLNHACHQNGGRHHPAPVRLLAVVPIEGAFLGYGLAASILEPEAAARQCADKSSALQLGASSPAT